MAAVVAVVAVKEAVAPLGVSVPPVADQVIAGEQLPVERRVALSAEVPPDGMVVGLALTMTPETTQVTAGVTVTTAEPLVVGSSTLVAVMV
jgi:hypothetical protein